MNAGIDRLESVSAAVLSEGASWVIRIEPEIPGPWSPWSANVFTPRTSPAKLSNGPPEFPGLMFTSEMIARCLTLLTIPEVTEDCWLNGKPTAMTRSPGTTMAPVESCLAMRRRGQSGHADG